MNKVGVWEIYNFLENFKVLLSTKQRIEISFQSNHNPTPLKRYPKKITVLPHKQLSWVEFELQIKKSKALNDFSLTNSNSTHSEWIPGGKQ
jgi:hypothetical protein